MDKDLILTVAGSLLLLVVTILLIAVPVNLLERSTCRATAKVMGVEYYYAWNTPCLLKINGQWIDRDHMNLNMIQGVK